MPMYNSRECKVIYSKTSGNLYHFFRGEPSLYNRSTTESLSFKFKWGLKDKTNNDGIINVKIVMPLI